MWDPEWGLKQVVAVGEVELTKHEITSLIKGYRDLAPVFKAKEVDELTPHWKMDCATELLLELKLPKGEMYSVNPTEREELHKFIDNNLERGYIHPMNSLHATPVLFWKKKDDSLRLCTDYKGLNTVSMSNVTWSH